MMLCCILIAQHHNYDMQSVSTDAFSILAGEGRFKAMWHQKSAFDWRTQQRSERGMFLSGLRFSLGLEIGV